jgi:hypothetical protein
VLERLREVPERDALLPQPALSLGAEEAGVDPGRERGAVHLDGGGQAAQVDRDRRGEAIPHGLHAAHDARAASERHHRHTVLGARGQDRGDLLGRRGERHRVRRARGVAGADSHEIGI